MKTSKTLSPGRETTRQDLVKHLAGIHGYQAVDTDDLDDLDDLHAHFHGEKALSTLQARRALEGTI